MRLPAIICILAMTTTSCAATMRPLGHTMETSSRPAIVTTAEVEGSQPAFVLPADQVSTLVTDQPDRLTAGKMVLAAALAVGLYMWEFITAARAGT